MDLKPKQIIEHAIAIAEEYRDQGLNLTLRQMYYQFVSRALCGSGQKEYARIGAVLTEARYTGEFPIDWLEDRGRSFKTGDFDVNSTDVDAALEATAADIGRGPSTYLWRSKWYGQPSHVTVLFEKEALAGVFEPVCNELGVGWMACKGYPSVSALHQWLKSAIDAELAGASEFVILYLGDHDPDGFGIPKALHEGIYRLKQLDDYDFSSDITLHRIALNMPQIRRYNPPPFDAKESSPRFARYAAEQKTRDAWELDALTPTVLRDLIRQEIQRYFDEGIARNNDWMVDELRAKMKERIQDREWIRQALEEIG